ncbi:MAG TPA: acetyltransferase [Candidatus Binatia bacterium]|nr:acetyltransferase [Candidatus Binatia bacterium]
MSAAAAPGIEIRVCHSLQDCEACVTLEKRIWQTDDVEVVPAALIRVVAETGGQVLGAFEGGRMIGFTFALAACRVQGGGLLTFLHSHMTAVLPEYQNLGIGRRLKLFQREEALGRGIRLVEWTFDPFELRNAYFNVMRLGAVMRRYLPNLYGITTSPLHSGIPTDRLVAEWYLDSPRVAAAAAGESPPAAGPDALRIAVPSDIGKIKERDRAEATRFQTRMRQAFLDGFARGFAVTRVESRGPTTDYVLEKFRLPPGGENSGRE